MAASKKKAAAAAEPEDRSKLSRMFEASTIEVNKSEDLDPSAGEQYLQHLAERK